MASIKEYWASMTPAQRSAEIKRRQAKSRRTSRPVSKNPFARKISAAGREAIREAQRKRWREQKQRERAGDSPDYSGQTPFLSAQGTIKARIEKLELQLAQLRAEVGI